MVTSDQTPTILLAKLLNTTYYNERERERERER